MLTEVDEGKGLVKVYWQDIRKRAMEVEPVFSKLVDKLSPNTNFPLFLAYYPYGALTGDTETTHLPTIDRGSYKLSDTDIPKDVTKHLGYAKNSMPLSMLLDKNMEMFIDLPNEKISIPWTLWKPGHFFPFSRILSLKNTRQYPVNGVLNATAGARSAFMLPNIGSMVNHFNLQRDFNIQLPPPKSLYEHWYIFKEIANSSTFKSEWRSCIIYFSKSWVDHLHNDSNWLELKMYLYEKGWANTEYHRNRFYYDIAFSSIQKNRNLKPNPYLADTAQHLFTIALGATPGFAPAEGEENLPTKLIQEAFVESYGLKKYFPTIMQPCQFIFETDKFPVYYSLQNPSTYVFSPKSRQASSTLLEMRELEHLVRIFSEELSKHDSICYDSIISLAAKNINFQYFHNKKDQHNIVTPSSKISTLDTRFRHSHIHNENAIFSSDAQFVRGCISIKID
ncbi:hypothetical protein [Piscirickettsia litoralis]|uniref:Uncharacterized protein n=1 Tax=Piscirickettsia litoralis TaxID=1891921 RepID=A0ABX3A2V4_9GAMM|nr:hypothetical protein [Piscirickettsia litoralis]ODN43204.1 hypothetical protein BGC07_10085 [Piscirickettsia litoralis]